MAKVKVPMGVGMTALIVSLAIGIGGGSLLPSVAFLLFWLSVLIAIGAFWVAIALYDG